MQTSDLAKLRKKKLELYLNTWPNSRFSTITLDEYAIGKDNFQDTFTQWVERKTEILGSIGGIGGYGSFKFGIFFPDKAKGNKSYKVKKLVSDGEVAWNT